jgi:cell division protein FtsI/penicillin-binding protein 2
MAFKQSRIINILVFFIVLGTLLFGRLFYLQLIEGPKLAAQSLISRVQEVPMEVARGEILDRNGVPLTNTAWHFSIVVFPDQIKNPYTTVVDLANASGLSTARIWSKIKEEKRPFKLKTDVDAVTAQKINDQRIPGVIAVAERLRYGSSSIAAHLVGYINLADNRGMSGIEKMYDDLLRGTQPDYVAAFVDAGQQVIPGLGYKRLRITDHQGPSNVILTLDGRIQKIVENVMDRYVQKGAVVIIKPNTGEVLAMCSRPGFDANHLGNYLNREDSPLLNRVVAAYQPGSVFKLVVAAAALETNQVKLTDKFFDKGYIDVNNLRFKGWDYDRGVRRTLTFLEAMAYSSNPILIEVALRLGAERLISYAQRLGFGHKTRLNLDDEADGNLPSPASLFPGDIANMAIGQGVLEASPMQIAGLISTIVNDGIKVDPYIVSQLVDTHGTVLKKFQPARGARILSTTTAQELRQMMTAVTDFGTGQAAAVEIFGSAGKTGTAETGRVNSSGKSINHAWFAGYAPLDNPQYVAVVFVEEGMSGGDIAAPIFREILTEVLK